jgi:NAD(P)-dependent dehydrogenase (short-subunit alcohol dehydrogenase family)
MGSAYVSTKFAIEGLTESMSYELEPFGIRTILIEPGVIKTNFFKATTVAKKALDPNSPYSKLMKGMEGRISELMENGSTPEYVAKVIIDAVASGHANNNPKLRYIAGKDLEQWMEAKKSMSDEEFHRMMTMERQQK